MDNVNDLRPTTDSIARQTPNQQPISLSALGTRDQPTVNINVTNGLSGVSASDEREHQVVRINPNPSRRASRRTVENRSQVNQVDPNEIIPKQKEPTRPTTIRDRAMGQLAAAVERKQSEYKQFVAAATEEDARNRELVEDGIETVGEEIQYMPNNLYEPIDEDEKVQDMSQEQTSFPANEEEEFFDEDSDVSTSEYDPTGGVSISNFGEIDEEEPVYDLLEQEKEVPEVEFIDPPETSNPNVKYLISVQVENRSSEEDLDLIDMVVRDNSLEPDENDVASIYHNNGEDSFFAFYIFGGGIWTPISWKLLQLLRAGTVEEEPESAVEEIDNSYEDNDMEISVPDEEEIQDEKEPVVESAPEPKYIPEAKNVVLSTIDTNMNSSDFDVDAEDFEDITQDTEEQLTDEQIKELDHEAEKNLRSDILKKIVNAGKRVNTAQFTVSNKVVNLKQAMRNVQKVERTAKWPLMFAGRPYISSSLKGPDIALLAELEDSSDNGFGINREQARIMYEHDASPYRPVTLEAWCKTIPIADIDAVYAAMFCASMRNANYMPMVCTKDACRNAFLSDDIPIENMLKIDNEEARKRFDSIKNMELTAESSRSYESVITVINENFAVGIKMPSIFNALYEYNTLNREFINKYSSIVAVLQYIDYIYVIDPETSQFVPVGWRSYVGDYSKTYKSKIATYAKVFKEFSPTDFALMTSLINAMIMREAEIKMVTFEIPKCKCTKCGSEISASGMTARQMLFTQQRLVALATTPTES